MTGDRTGETSIGKGLSEKTKGFRNLRLPWVVALASVAATLVLVVCPAGTGARPDRTRGQVGDLQHTGRHDCRHEHSYFRVGPHHQVVGDLGEVARERARTAYQSVHQP